MPFEGKFVVGAETTTRADGSFRFDELPLDLGGPYLPGANWRGIHFPGSRVRLTKDRTDAKIVLEVFESSEGPCPLVVERHDVTIQAESGRVAVRELLSIHNPSSRCFVGQPRHAGGGPVTMELRIPAEFKQVTFDREGFARGVSPHQPETGHRNALAAGTTRAGIYLRD